MSFIIIFNKLKHQAVYNVIDDNDTKALCEAFLQHFEVKEEVSKVLVKTARAGASGSQSSQSWASKLKLGKPANFNGTPGELSNFLFSL